MSCAVELELTAYIDGELPASRREAVAVHLARCPTCQQTAEVLRDTVSKLVSLPPVEVSGSLRSAVLSRIAQEPVRARHKLRDFLQIRLLLPSAGLAATAAMALLLWTRPSRELHELRQYELGANLEIIEDYEVLGITSIEDLDVVQHLHELEAHP